MVARCSLLLGVLAVVTAADDPKCSMTGQAYPPALKPLPDGEARNISTFVIDLDEDASTRWNKVVVPLKEEIHALIDVITNTLDKILGNETVANTLAKLEGNLPLYYSRLPAEFGSEIDGIAKAINISPAKIFIYNIFYTIFGACTSIVAQSDAGEIIHARNLDFGLWPALDLKDGQFWKLTAVLRPIIVNIDFQRSSKLVFHSTTFAGFIGVHTASKPGAFSLTIDTRFDSNMDLSLIRWIEEKHMDRDLEVTMLTRQAFQEQESFAAFFDVLNSTKVIGPAYLILSGVSDGEGAVITKGKAGAMEGETVDVWQLSDQIAQNDTYFLVETNYDRTGPAPSSDDRRDPAMLCMKDLTPSKYDFNGLYNVLNAVPNLNRLTVFTTLMDAKKGRYEAYREYCVGLKCPLV